MKLLRCLPPIAIALSLAGGQACAADMVPVRLNTFPNARSLPFYFGLEKGIFAKRGIKLEVEYTENSRNLRDGLASGKYDVVHSAVDNAVAMVEMSKVDVIIVSGGDSGANEFIVQKTINSWDDIRGKALVVDAPNTAYALVGKKILLKHGLKEGVDYKLNTVGNGERRLEAMMQGGDNAAATMNLPFSAQAIEAGMKSLGRTNDMLGPYQAGGAFVLRSWAKANGPTLERYLAGYIDALRWVLDKNHREEAVAMLMNKQKLAQALAERSYDALAEPGFGFSPDARFDMEGFNNVLAMRQEIEGGPAPDPGKYLDLSYYERAIRGIAR